MQVTSTGISTAGTGATTASSAASGTTGGSTPTVDYNQFLQLLVAQMKNQDPLSPQDPTAFMSQLASFSNVEQAVKTNSKLDQLLTSDAMTQAEGLIGHSVSSADGTTTGVVQSVQIGASGSTAQLDNGAQLPLSAGVTVNG